MIWDEEFQVNTEALLAALLTNNKYCRHEVLRQDIFPNSGYTGK